MNRQEQMIKEVSKYKRYTRVLEQWIALKQIGVTFASWFEENHFRKIAVYGLGEVGQLFIKELSESDVEVCYGIDRRHVELQDIKVKGLEDEFESVDVVVVTALTDFGIINDFLKEKTDCPVVSLENIIYELY